MLGMLRISTNRQLDLSLQLQVIVTTGIPVTAVNLNNERVVAGHLQTHLSILKLFAEKYLIVNVLASACLLDGAELVVTRRCRWETSEATGSGCGRSIQCGC